MKALVTVQKNGCIYVLQLTSHFKTSLKEQGKTLNEICKSCKDVLCTKAGFSAFRTSDKLGKLIYNDKLFYAITEEAQAGNAGYVEKC